MQSHATVRSARLTLERLESRDLLSNLPNLAMQFLLPLGQQEAAASSASLQRLKDMDTALAKVANTAPAAGAAATTTNNQAAVMYAQAASAYQDVLTETRSLELSFVSILDFFGFAIQQGGDFANDQAAFINVVEPMLNTSRATVQANETAANKLGIVTTGINTAAAAPAGGGAVSATTTGTQTATGTGPIGLPVTIAVAPGTNLNVGLNLPPLGSQKAAVVTIAQTYNFSRTLWPLLPTDYTPPATTLPVA